MMLNKTVNLSTEEHFNFLRETHLNHLPPLSLPFIMGVTYCKNSHHTWMEANVSGRCCECVNIPLTAVLLSPDDWGRANVKCKHSLWSGDLISASIVKGLIAPWANFCYSELLTINSYGFYSFISNTGPQSACWISNCAPLLFGCGFLSACSFQSDTWLIWD